MQNLAWWEQFEIFIFVLNIVHKASWVIVCRQLAGTLFRPLNVCIFSFQCENMQLLHNFVVSNLQNNALFAQFTNWAADENCNIWRIKNFYLQFVFFRRMKLKKEIQAIKELNEQEKQAQAAKAAAQAVQQCDQGQEPA